MSSPDRAELNSPAGDPPAMDLGPDVATETQALFLVRLRNLGHLFDLLRLLGARLEHAGAFDPQGNPG
jgi:hypothetical protein